MDYNEIVLGLYLGQFQKNHRPMESSLLISDLKIILQKHHFENIYGAHNFCKNCLKMNQFIYCTVLLLWIVGQDTMWRGNKRCRCNWKTVTCITVPRWGLKNYKLISPGLKWKMAPKWRVPYFIVGRVYFHSKWP